MRIVVMYDIHGNPIALDTVLADARRPAPVDEYWVLGDLVAQGFEPVPMLERLTALPNLRFVRGNPARDETLSRASLDSATYAVVLSKNPADPRSDDLNVAITLAIEARSKKVHTVVECVDFSTQELLRKAGCDGIVCTSRFDAHFLSHELLNPGIQEVVEELTTNARGQQIYITRFDGKKHKKFSDLAELCREQGHMAIGVRNGSTMQINVSPDTAVEPGDHVITIGATRLSALG